MAPVVVRRRLVPVASGAVVAALVLAGCGGGSDDEGAGSGPLEVGVLYDVGGVGDHGLDDGVNDALRQAEEELDATVQELEPDDEGSDREVLLRSMARDGADVVVAVGGASAEALDAVAHDFPETTFVLVGAAGTERPNVTSIVFAEEQGAYLAGAAAALTAPGHHLGFLSGDDDASTQAYEAGFRAGARKVLDSVRVDAVHVPATPEGAVDAAQVAAAAKGLFDGGAEVVLGAPREVTAALLAAAVQHGPGARVIGTDGDAWREAPPEQQPFVLTSVVERADVALFDALRVFAQSALGAGVRTYAVSDDGIGYATSGGTLPADVTARLDDLRAQLADGRIQAPAVP